MSSKSQRRKERHTRKRQEKRKNQVRRKAAEQREITLSVGSNQRHRQHLALQVPRAWEGETAVDVAMFDEGALAGLTPELAAEVALVRDALQEALDSRSDDALKRLSAISRSSPLSQWRLFVRGLVDWLADDIQGAHETWKRLDCQRRPGRIASAMMLSLEIDPDSRTPSRTKDKPNDVPAWGWRDDTLLDHARLLRRIRIDRPALRVAEVGAKAPEEERKLRLGPRKLKWLRQFVQEYGDTEPDLAAALSRTALARAFAQGYSNLFDDAAQGLPGPRHDPRNILLTFFFYSQYTDDSFAEKRAARALDKYLTSLSQNEALSPPLRGAIASQIHYYEAKNLILPKRALGFGMLGPTFAPREDASRIRKHLKAAWTADPRNVAIYQTYSEWLESKLDDERLTQPKRKPFEQELAGVMRRWSQGRPEDVEPRLWLVDYLLENEELEEARPHVDFLAATRHDNPRVKATPWKWHILDAMRLCRRKAWLDQVPARLDEAEALWPDWLSKRWLSYLQEAWELRKEASHEFENLRLQICQEARFKRGSLADVCLMLGAAQLMRVSAQKLKGLRAEVDQVVKRLNRLPLTELIEAGSAFWDLHRVKLVYPAYRMHGSKIGRALVARWNASPKTVVDAKEDPDVQKAILWCSEYRFWESSYYQLPAFLTVAVNEHPVFAAATLNAALKHRYPWSIAQYSELGSRLREKAQMERDPYYRYWFFQLADSLEDAIAQNRESGFGFPFGNFFGMDEGEEDYGGDEDFLDYDPECDCPSCREARQAASRTQSTRRKSP